MFADGGFSSSTKAERGYEIGWRPTRTEEDWKLWPSEEFRAIHSGEFV
ncbi:hypothetical protein IMZ48_12455 [Candidatus Bathyarchaeota archaeon]|nr:hypothetical protein [Candidatus Bathyarchaeota archaeon]